MILSKSKVKLKPILFNKITTTYKPKGGKKNEWTARELSPITMKTTTLLIVVKI